ncbi:MAG: Dam family site-specific DNA-(adenine-N6)-methyltransferase [Gammaproteobacteria bacterium]|nr:Dam family site-specific DNA-(adenine-N6)-methyltransferase [Gammaproteobacteria bacterium]
MKSTNAPEGEVKKEYQRPFLKWTGSKMRVLPEIEKYLPAAPSRLIEPFVGCGALFINSGAERYLLNDINSDLINLYKVLQSDAARLIDGAAKFFTPENNAKEPYLALRQRFNLSRDPYERSILFVYLNRHCFNGLCRYNSKGVFNVPAGSYATVSFQRQWMQEFANKLRLADLYNEDFAATFARANKGDVIYADPPFVGQHKDTHIFAYHGKVFDAQAHQRLADVAKETAQRGVTVLISNHDTPFTREIYHPAEIHSFAVTRFVSAKASQRGAAQELLALFKPAVA